MQELRNVEKLGFSKREAAQATSLSPRSIDYLLARGVLKGVKVGSRVIIQAKSLAKLIQNGTASLKEDGSEAQ